MGMKIFCKPTATRHVPGWESSPVVWMTFKQDLSLWLTVNSPLHELMAFDRYNNVISAVTVPALLEELKAIRPEMEKTFGWLGDSFKLTELDNLIKCCNVAVANRIPLQCEYSLFG